jgi:hypothetical protein
MYVVLEFNQASGQPRIYDTDIYYTRGEAESQAEYAREQLAASGSGRRETYAVAELNWPEED